VSEVALTGPRGRWSGLPRWTLRLRFTLAYGGLFVVSAAAVLAITYLLVARFLAGIGSPLVQLLPSRLSGNAGSQYLVIKLNAVGGIGTPVPGSPPAGGPGSGASQSTTVITNAQIVGQTAHQHAVELHHLLVGSGVALGLMAVVSVVVGWLLAGRVLRPVRQMAGAAQQISEENLERRLAVVGPRDELSELGDSFDRLLARLEGAFGAQRNFVANASHELRTPLTLARTLLQVRLRDPAATVEAYRSTCEKVLVTTTQQEAFIESLLVLARSQHGLEERHPFDLADVTHEILSFTHDATAARGVSLNATVSAAPVCGDATLTSRLVANLVDNAIRYNIDEGHVEVVVETRQGKAVFEVTNSGPTVAATEVERLLQPFQRQASDRGSPHQGTGLGLSIAAAIATAHGAPLTVHARPGGGLIVTTTFPLDRPSTPATG
jgi:signal transduction histidine kinase